MGYGGRGVAHCIGDVLVQYGVYTIILCTRNKNPRTAVVAAETLTGYTCHDVLFLCQKSQQQAD